MRKLIIAAAALAFICSTALVPSSAFAQDKSSDTMSKGDMSKDKMSKKSTKKKSSMKKTGDDMQKQ